MKYIRTKNGIIYVGDLIKDEYGNYCNPKNYDTDMEVSNEYIIKEADTIEELCDEIIGVDKTCYQFLRAFPYKCAGFWSGGVYGAIWTDKGLIYVAKMNDEGELELI